MKFNLEQKLSDLSSSVQREVDRIKVSLRETLAGRGVRGIEDVGTPLRELDLDELIEVTGNVLDRLLCERRCPTGCPQLDFDGDHCRRFDVDLTLDKRSNLFFRSLDCAAERHEEDV